MGKNNQFLDFLKEKLEQYESFYDWKNLEFLTAECSKHIIQQNSNYSSWIVEYNKDAHSFPDIIIKTPNGNWGIEVKSSKSKNWETLGGSINESTKISGLDNIFILFAKNIDNKVHVKIKEFWRCVKSVAVTHSPRYLIDMEIGDGEDIFSRLNTTYQEVSNHKYPFEIFKEYFKEKAKNSNTKFWFLSDQENERSSETYQELEWKFFNQLSKQEKNSLIAEAIILYPYDIFGYPKKSIYDNSNLFFLGRGVISNSMRDNFSAGGIIKIDGYPLSQRYSLLQDNILSEIAYLLSTEPTIEMKNIYKTNEIVTIRNEWLKQISNALCNSLSNKTIVQILLNNIKDNIF